ncbi:MAG TPA: trypsin, partial [Massilia timonae]|nr:trypsin [Massilia timonae]
MKRAVLALLLTCIAVGAALEATSPPAAAQPQPQNLAQTAPRASQNTAGVGTGVGTGAAIGAPQMP